MAKSISAEEFDRMFDEGEEDVTQFLELGKATRPNSVGEKVLEQ